MGIRYSKTYEIRNPKLGRGQGVSCLFSPSLSRVLCRDALRVGRVYICSKTKCTISSKNQSFQFEFFSIRLLVDFFVSLRIRLFVK